MIDINKPVTNPDFVLAMKTMKDNNTGENQDHMIDEMMKAHFITPAIISPQPDQEKESQEVVLKEKTTISFHIIQNTENQNFFMAFTDWEELRKWQDNENQQVIIVTFDDLAGMILNEASDSSGYVINPFGESVIFTRPMVEALKIEKERRANINPAENEVIEQVIEKDTQVLLGEPKDYPHQMMDAISTQLKKIKQVEAGYMRLMVKDSEESYLMILDFQGEKEPIFGAVATAAKPFLNGKFIDMVEAKSSFGQNAIKDVIPFYKKKKFGIF